MRYSTGYQCRSHYRLHFLFIKQLIDEIEVLKSTIPPELREIDIDRTLKHDPLILLEDVASLVVMSALLISTDYIFLV